MKERIPELNGHGFERLPISRINVFHKNDEFKKISLCTAAEALKRSGTMWDSLKSEASGPLTGASASSRTQPIEPTTPRSVWWSVWDRQENSSLIGLADVKCTGMKPLQAGPMADRQHRCTHKLMLEDRQH